MYVNPSPDTVRLYDTDSITATWLPGHVSDESGVTVKLMFVRPFLSRWDRWMRTTETTEMSDVLMVQCPDCREWFASAIQMDPETWEAIRMNSGLMERCFHCGRASRFSKPDYSFRSG